MEDTETKRELDGYRKLFADPTFVPEGVASRPLTVEEKAACLTSAPHDPASQHRAEVEARFRSRWNSLSPEARWAFLVLNDEMVRSGLRPEEIPWIYRRLLFDDYKLKDAPARADDRDAFVLMRLPSDEGGRFTRMAETLRSMWPQGLRTVRGREYGWTEPVGEVRRKLQTVWLLRRLDEFADEEVYSCARRYLSRYTDDARYMLSLGNWVLKVRTTKDRDSDVSLREQRSMMADMMEGLAEECLECDCAAAANEAAGWADEERLV